MSPPTPDPIKRAATAVFAASSLAELMDLEPIFPDISRSPAAEAIKEHLFLELEHAIETSDWEPLKSGYQRPKLTGDEDSRVALLAVTLYGIPVLMKEFGSTGEDWSKAAYEACSVGLRRAIEEFREFMVFDCRQPTGADDFPTKERALLLLQRCWHAYRAILLHFSEAELGYTPNPLSRFIANLKDRIEMCLTQISDPAFNL